MNVIFDSNAYRELSFGLKDLSEIERINRINYLKMCLNKKDISIKINYWVLCEVMQHLCDPNDPAYINCVETLKLMLRLSEKDGQVGFTSMFEVSLSKKYNDKNVEEYFTTLEKNTASLAIEFGENGRSEIFERNICFVADYIKAYKEALYKGFLEAKTELKKAGNKNIPLDDDKLHLLVLLARMKGILQIELDSIDIKVLEELQDSHYFGLARTIKVLKNGYHSDNLSPAFLNNFVDQAICDSIGKNNSTILVTNDGRTKEGIRTTFIDKNRPDKTMLLEDFIYYIEQS